MSKEAPGAIWFRNHPRLGGVGFALFCWSLAGWAHGAILQQAAEQKPRIAVVFCLPLLVSVGFMGLICLLFGRRAVETLQSFGERKKDAVYFGLIAAILAPGLIDLFWLLHQLSLLGYR